MAATPEVDMATLRAMLVAFALVGTLMVGDWLWPRCFQPKPKNDVLNASITLGGVAPSPLAVDRQFSVQISNSDPNFSGLVHVRAMSSRWLGDPVHAFTLGSRYMAGVGRLCVRCTITQVQFSADYVDGEMEGRYYVWATTASDPLSGQSYNTEHIVKGHSRTRSQPSATGPPE
ncbi:MAG: hypothetical protein ABFD96_25145 [Armatimonadia bacterium]